MRAGILLFHPESRSTCLVFRQKNGRTYAVLPGGGLEDGESFLQAAQRELKEELAITAPISQFKPAFEIDNSGRKECYFLLCQSECLPLSIFGEEKERSSETNVYQPQWVALSDLKEQNIQPPQLTALITDYFQKGFS